MRAAAWSASSDGLGFDVGHDNVLLLARCLARKAPDAGRYGTRPERSLVAEIVSPRLEGVNPPMWRRAYGYSRHSGTTDGTIEVNLPLYAPQFVSTFLDRSRGFFGPAARSQQTASQPCIIGRS